MATIAELLRIREVLGRPMKGFEGKDFDFILENYEVPDILQGIEEGKAWAEAKDLGENYSIRFYIKFIQGIVHGRDKINFNPKGTPITDNGNVLLEGECDMEQGAKVDRHSTTQARRRGSQDKLSGVLRRVQTRRR